MKVTIMNHYINDTEKGFGAFVNKCIGFFTKSEAWHTSIILGDTRYESGHPYGASKSLTIPDHKYVDTYDIFVTDAQFADMVKYAELKLKQNLRYNHYKLLILAICYPTRWLWNRVRFVPFQHDYFGQVCSVFVREILLAGRIDLFPGLYKELTAPADFAKL